VPERLFENFGGMSDRLIDKITHRNAMEFFNFDPFAILGRENCTVAALRAKATGVDTSVRSVGAERRLGREGHAVTSGEVLAQLV